jgi:hypothetical protein
MSTVKSKKLQVGTDATSSNNFTIYQPATPDGTLRIGVGNADSPTEVARFDATGMISGGATPDALSTASGSAPSYSARAWVNFNGTGTVAIRSSGNVSSITDNGTGYYTVNFANAMPDSNFSTVALHGADTPNLIRDTFVTGRATSLSDCYISVFRLSNPLDSPYVQVAVFR